VSLCCCLLQVDLRAMEIYPTGLMPNEHPLAGLAAHAQHGSSASCMLPWTSVSTERSLADEPPFHADEMEFLERVFRECHLHDGPSQVIQLPQTPDTKAGAASTDCDIAQNGGSSANMLQTRQQQANMHASVEQWAGEIVRQMQTSMSPEDAHRRCVTLLGNFQQQSACIEGCPRDKVQLLQGTNRVLLRGFRNLYHRLGDSEAQKRRLEEANAQLAHDLARCQEALRVSERAKSTLQYHVQILGASPSTAAGGM